MATIKDVAHLAGVSVATVSHVLTGKVFVSRPLAERVRRAVEELDYQPNLQARNLRRKVTGLLGLIVPDNGNPFFSQLAKGVEDTAYRAGYVCILSNSTYDAARELAYVDALVAHRADGIILIPVSGGLSLERLARRGTAVVLADRKASSAAVDSVRVDNWKGGYLAGEHLVSLGHKRIACISHPEEQELGHLHERTSGFLQAIADADLKATVYRGGLGYQAGEEVAAAILDGAQRPSAIFAYDDVTAIGVMRAARERRLSVPDDLSVVGFDDIPAAAMLEPPLTTVAQDAYRLGETACELLLRRLRHEGPPERQEVLLEPELVVRESTAAPRGVPAEFPRGGVN